MWTKGRLLLCILFVLLENSCRKDVLSIHPLASIPIELNELQVFAPSSDTLEVHAELFLTASMESTQSLHLEVSVNSVKMEKVIEVNNAGVGKFFTTSLFLNTPDRASNKLTLDYCKVHLEGTSKSLLSRPYRLLINESVGRHPGIRDSFIIYPQDQSTIGTENSDPGATRKISSFSQFSPRDSSPNAILEYQGALWIFGGWDQNPDESFSSKANIWKSENSIDWSLVNSAPPFTHYSNFLVHNNQIFIYTENNTLLTTIDGITFHEEQLPTTVRFSESNIIKLNNQLFLLYQNTIGHSKDGIHWTFQENPFPGAPRKGAGLIQFKGKLYYFGGAIDYNDYATYYNDVYTSEDGVNWTKVTEKAEWTPRYWFNYTVLNDKLWIINGWAPSGPENEYGNYAEAWSTEDGIKWARIPLEMPARHASFGVAFKNRYLLIAGFGSRFPTRMYNDVWEFDPN